ncbi:MAG: hypothetical protein IV086_00465 [Hyphomonadaceae bacterium]|nr:MAG: hypothetical protein FD160_1379 [Caulobacteraceae bacterium]MBT9444149.1 hypothetical protein [Hyphomonadaceae bacterium]TPW04892.1 MAG: hypothetical protein FD124_2405 [Alphaproteobacteria bacterium]
MASGIFSSAADLATAAGVMIGAVSLVAGVANARAQQHFLRLEREAAALGVMNSRFQDVAEIRRQLTARSSDLDGVSGEEVYSFYAKYWALQIDQWEHYRLGVISKSVYVTWLCYLYDSLSGFHTIGSMDSRTSWEAIGRSLSRNSVEFRCLVEQLYILNRQNPLPDTEGSVFTGRPGRNRGCISKSGLTQELQERLGLRSSINEILARTPMWVVSGRLPADLARAISIQ